MGCPAQLFTLASMVALHTRLAMKFPLQKGRSTAGLGARRGECPVCHKRKVHEPYGFAFLTGGALRKIGRKHSTIDPNLVGFLTLGYHGAHNSGLDEPSVILDIADGVTLGQFDFYFCSTKCLRMFLNKCVDELDRRLKTKSRSPRRRVSKSSSH